MVVILTVVSPHGVESRVEVDVGDFDGDGHIDIGGEGSVCGLGVSLGSMVVVNLGSLEPTLDCIAAVLPGGGIADISARVYGWFGWA